MKIIGTAMGAAIAPTLHPAFMMPAANARSFLGNHSAMVLTQAGKFPASPRPNRNRAMLNPVMVLMKACDMQARLQKMTETEKPLRVPIQSRNRPALTKPIA